MVECDFAEGKVGAESGVVDDDVDLEFLRLRVGEVVFGGGDDVGGAVGLAHVGLDGDGFDAVLLLQFVG